MDTQAIDKILRQTLEDKQLSRGERQALGQTFAGMKLDANGRATVRSRAFEVARGALDGPAAKAVVTWLEDVVRTLESDAKPSGGALAEAFFSPGTACRERIIALLRSAQRSADLCVFTIADDPITRAIREAHQRGVKVRIVTDNDKCNDPGSDVHELANLGVPTVVDRTEAHMHHKFAVIDGKVLLTGSYNWTRSAAEWNAENVLVTDDARLVGAFQGEFEKLWKKFS